MNKFKAILRYKTAMAVFNNWLKCGAISGDDLHKVSEALAAKYDLSLSSIYLDHDLTCRENRVIDGSTKGG